MVEIPIAVLVAGIAMALAGGFSLGWGARGDQVLKYSRSMLEQSAEIERLRTECLRWGSESRCRDSADAKLASRLRGENRTLLDKLADIARIAAGDDESGEGKT